MVALILICVLAGMIVPLLVALGLSLRTPIPRNGRKTIPAPAQTFTFALSHTPPRRFDDPRQRDLELLLPTVARYGERIDMQQQNIERMLEIVAELKKQRHITKSVPWLLDLGSIALIDPSDHMSGTLTISDPDIDETDNASIEYATP